MRCSTLVTMLTIALALLCAVSAVHALTIFHDQDPVSATGDDFFEVSFTTDEPTIGNIGYGLNGTPDKHVQNNTFTRTHRLRIEGLQPQTAYLYHILAIAEHGETKIDNNNGQMYRAVTRTQVDRNGPQISNISVDTAGGAIVHWTTDEPSTSLVLFGAREPTTLRSDDSLVRDHSVTIDIERNVMYALIVGGCDAEGNCRNATRTGFFTGEGNLPFNVSVPTFARNNRVDVQGTTVPGSQVRVLINGETVRATVATDGTFRFNDVLFSGASVVLTISVKDVSGKTIERQFSVTSDSKPPILQLTKGIPDYTADGTLVLTGTVNEPVTITAGVERPGVAPPRVTGLVVERTTANTVHLAWAPVQNVTHYAIYRNGKRVGVLAQTRYIDSVSAAGAYRYNVKAIGQGCKESLPSETVLAQTSSVGLTVDADAPEPPLVCDQGTQSIQASGQFSITLQLAEGQNAVFIEAKDRAGNVVRIRNVTTVDTKPLQFLENNLNELSPTYKSSVEVKGRLNKQATVLIYLNDDKPIVVVTDENGKFSKEVTLSRDAKLKSTKKPLSATASYSETWENKIRITAIDLARRNATIGPIPVLYGLCGSGGAFQVTVGKPLPDVLTPRLILQGVQQAGFTINATYRGGAQFARPPRVTVRPILLSQAEAKNYDHDWVQVNYLNNPRKPTEGFVQLTFNVPEKIAQSANGTGSKEEQLSKHREGDCLVPAFGCVRLLLEVDVTGQEKIQKTIGDPRVQETAENFFLRDISQRTCIDVELQIDKSLTLQDKIPKGFLRASIDVIDSATEIIDGILEPLTTIGTYTLYSCMAMNGVLYGSYFSENLACDFADLEAQGIKGLMEKALGRNTIRDVASVGLCEATFGGPQASEDQTKVKAYGACKKCQEAIGKRTSLEQKMRLVCDRVACPSAPTLQTYIKDKQKEKLTIVRPPAITTTTGLPNNVQGLVYAGSSCSFNGQGGQRLSPGYTSGASTSQEFLVTTDAKGLVTGVNVYNSADGTPNAKPQPASPTDAAAVRSIVDAKGATSFFQFDSTSRLVPVSFSDRGVKEVYLNYLKHREDKPLQEAQVAASSVPGASSVTVVGAAGAGPTCTGLYPANPECCGSEYQREWGSACGVPGFFETFDEIKESVCLAAQNANKIGDLERDASAAAAASGGGGPIVCKSLFNSVAGFCEPGSGQPVGDVLPTRIRYDAKVYETLAAPDSTEIYVDIFPTGPENKEYRITRGYIRKSYARIDDPAKAERADKEKAKAEKLQADRQTTIKDRVYVNSQLDFVPDDDDAADLSIFFVETETTRNLKPGQLPPGFAAALCKNAIDKGSCTGTRAKQVYDDIRSHVGVSDKTYIVRPDRDGVLRSVQCACIPAVTSYLQFWKNVLTAVRGCFQTVLTTGEANAGICQAVLSQYVCDLLFDTLRCFTEKYSTPGVGTQLGGRGGIGDVLGSLSKSGGDMQRSINGRYGDTALWKTMFVERKLVHSMCAFAFTGTWDLDVSGIFKQSVDQIPVQTQGVLYPSERRFISYNPFTRPAGLPTFTYHFGVGLAAGEDIRYNLELVCSNTARCEPRDGFELGKCDCFGRGEQRIIVGAAELGNGQLKKNDILNTEVFYTLQGGDRSSAVRYDKAILSWEAFDPKGREAVTGKVEQPIHTVGSHPPNFCRFDPLSLSYRCDIGIGDYSGARIISATPHYPGTQQAIILGQPVSFDVEVNLEYPEGEKQLGGCALGCSYTKWINYEVRNQNSQVLKGKLTPEQVMDPSNNLRVEQKGTNVKTINIGALTQQMFSFAQQGSSGVQFGGPESARFTTPEPDPSRPLLQGLVLVITSLGQNKGYKWELFASEREAVSTEANYIARTPQTEQTGLWGYFKKSGAALDVGETIQAGRVTTPKHGVSFVIPTNVNLQHPVEYHLPRSAPTGTGGNCDPFKDKPAEFSVTVSLYDSATAAGGTAYEYNGQQPTVDPSSGEVQQATFTIKTYCSTTYQGPTGTVRACTADEGTPQAFQCFCGSNAQMAAANQQLRDDPSGRVLNCGPGLNFGEYCIRSNPANPADDARRCQFNPGTTTPSTSTGPQVDEDIIIGPRNDATSGSSSTSSPSTLGGIPGTTAVPVP